MANRFYTKVVTAVDGATASAADLEDSKTSIQTGFDLVEAEIDLDIHVAAGVSTGFDGEISEDAATRAGKLLSFTSDGQGIEVTATAADVATVAGIDDEVVVVAGISASVVTAAANDANITTVAGSISNVNATGGSISNVNTVAGSIANVNTTAGSITNVNTVGAAIANVNTTATNIASVNTAATNIAAIIDAPNQASAAAASASAAALSASTAQTQATAASTSANSAASSASSAATSETNAAAAWSAALASDPDLNPAFRMNPSTLTADITIPSYYNAFSAGPLTIGLGSTVTVNDNANWSII